VILNKRLATFITLVIGLLAVSAPITVAILLARHQGRNAHIRHSLAYARDVLHRSNTTVDQIDAGIRKLVSSGGNSPCSEHNIAIMREIDVASSYIQATGHVRGDTLICSSLGSERIDLGPVDLVTQRQVRVRENVRFPFAPDTSFIVVERDGYAAVIHKSLPIDATTIENDASLGMFSTVDSRLLATRGTIRPEWVERLVADNEQIIFTDGGYVVAVLRSSRYFIGSIVAVPVAYLDAQTASFARWLVPIGLGAGIVLAFVVVHLARIQLAMPAVIRTALKRNEFFMVYQPVVELSTNTCVGAEALIRWRRSSGEMVSPELFIPVAEDSGLIEKITHRVIELVARDLASVWRRHPDFHIAINISAVDVTSATTVQLLKGFASRSGNGPQNVILEITERAMVDTDAARRFSEQLPGTRLVIDDFGTGYSSLSYLQTFRFHALKIDRSFVKTLGTQAATHNVAPHIIQMARALDLEIIAEGIETEEQAEYLRSRGVQFGQGWLFGKPVDVRELAMMLERPRLLATAGQGANPFSARAVFG
jgi:sensor c-di-GMP phosphodiesterase-like protein